MKYEARRQFRRLLGVGLGLVSLIVLLLAVLSADRDLGTTISIFSTRFLGIFIEAVPFLLLGTLASGLIDSFVSAEDIARLVPRKPVLATFMGSFLGFIFPVCECGVVPVVRRLYTKGLPMSVGITFLLAAPVMNPIVLASTWVAFGLGPILYGRFIMTVVISMLVGLVFAFAGRPQEVLRPASLAPAMGGAGTVPPRAAGAPASGRKPLKAGLRDALSMAVDEFFEMGRYLVIGTLLAAAMQTLISQDMLMALGRGPVISVIVMQALAFVLSVCSTVDSFLALAFIGTFTTGSILAFLVFGPMVDIKSAMMFAGVFRPKIVVYLIVLPALLALLISVWLNLNVAF
jgi:uncharacterized membrane protein YraQ (UPF0718 family)